MIKKTLLFLFLFTTVIFSNSIASVKKVSEKSAIQEIKAEIDKGKFYHRGTIIADTTDADAFLEVLHKAKGDISRNYVVLILPDVDKLDKNVAKLTKRVKGVRALMLNIKTDYKELKNRSMEELKEKGIYKKIKDIKNLNIDEIVVDEAFLKSKIGSDGSVDALTKDVYERLGIKK